MAHEIAFERPKGVSVRTHDLGTLGLSLVYSRYKTAKDRARAMMAVRPGNMDAPVNPEGCGLLTPEELRDAVYHWQHSEEGINPVEARLIKNPRLYEVMTIHDISTAEYAAFNKKFWEEQFAVDTRTLSDLEGWRIQCAYRIVREMAISRNMCSPEEPLSVALAQKNNSADPWQEVRDTFIPADAYRVCHGLIEALRECAFLEEQDHSWWLDTEIVDGEERQVIRSNAGFPLMPPPPPLRHYDEQTGQLSTEYDPYTDVALLGYVKGVRSTAIYLQIPNGSLEEPSLGQGLLGLMDPQLVRLAMPTPNQLMQWEYILTEQVMNYLIQNGAGVRKWMEQKYGFTPRECNAFVRMAKDMARRVTEASIEEERGMMMIRLMDYAKRARKALDMKAEMAAYKQMAMVTGLTRAEAEDQMTDLIDVVKKVTQSQSAATRALTSAVMPRMDTAAGPAKDVLKIVNGD